MKRNLRFIILLIVGLINACGENYTHEQKEYIASIEKQRQEKDDYMKNDPNSPFNFKGKVEFHPLKYFGVGRYLDFELNADKDFLYTIDFNLAYNPYCAYSADYTCAIPTKEDYVDLKIEAGEKKYH